MTVDKGRENKFCLKTLASLAKVPTFLVETFTTIRFLFVSVVVSFT